MNTTIFDTDPGLWVNLGVEAQSDGTRIYKTFDELWDMYQNPDRGDVVSQNEIIAVNIFSSCMFCSVMHYHGMKVNRL